MKFPRLLPFAVAVVVFALSPVALRADDKPDAKRLAAAEEFLQARKMADLVNSTANQMADNTDRISEGVVRQAAASVDHADLLQKMRAEARAMVVRELGWEAVRPAFIEGYAKAFTEAELHEMTAFYRSPVGQKLVATDPVVLGEFEKINSAKAKALLPKLFQRLREMVAATNPAGSAPPLLAPPLPPGLSVPPTPPPGLMPPAAPPTLTPPVATPPPAAAPNSTPAVHP